MHGRYPKGDHPLWCELSGACGARYDAEPQHLGRTSRVHVQGDEVVVTLQTVRYDHPHPESSFTAAGEPKISFAIDDGIHNGGPCGVDLSLTEARILRDLLSNYLDLTEGDLRPGGEATWSTSAARRALTR